jgi:hypothetical protein
MLPMVNAHPHGAEVRKLVNVNGWARRTALSEGQRAITYNDGAAFA